MSAPDPLQHVLVVDLADSATVDQLAALRRANTALHRVTSVSAALRIVAEARVDVVLLLSPPGDARGSELLRVVAAVRERPDAPALWIGAPAQLGEIAMRGEGPPVRRSATGPRRDGDAFADMVGASPPLRRMQQLIRRVAPTDRPVLVRGPTGAGKEGAVQALHALGPHPHAPLLDLNCGAIPEALMESLLFGHVRGAFTGADTAQEGYLAAVGTGTLFLDEVAELPLTLQAKLLRVLETRRYRRVGSTEERVFSGRVVAATHADLLERCTERRFRSDLYYRLAVLTVEVPPLAARPDDVSALVEHFSARQPIPLSFTAEALAILRAREWPGNVRQLRNTIDRLAVTIDERPVTVAALSEAFDGDGPTPPLAPDAQELASALLGLDGEDKLAAVQDFLIDAAMREHGGNKSAAARALGVHRKVIERRLGRENGALPHDAE